MLLARLPAAVGEAVERIRERGEQGRVENGEPGGGGVAAAALLLREGEDDEDDCAQDRGATERAPPRRRLWHPAGTSARLLGLGLLGLRARAVSPLLALLLRGLELFRRLLDLAALGIDVHELVLVALRLRLAAPLLPGRH